MLNLSSTVGETYLLTTKQTTIAEILKSLSLHVQTCKSTTVLRLPRLLLQGRNQGGFEWFGQTPPPGLPKKEVVS